MSMNIKKIKNIACMLDNIQKTLEIADSGQPYTLKFTGDNVVEFSIVPKEANAQAAFSSILTTSLQEYSRELERALKNEVKAHLNGH
jgi:hypothetical protein